VGLPTPEGCGEVLMAMVGSLITAWSPHVLLVVVTPCFVAVCRCNRTVSLDLWFWDPSRSRYP
jgi:hypothetical protein